MTKYEKWYSTIIETRKATPYDGDYSESHHIIPRCVGGTDDKENLVVLSAREHFICHLLLSKIYDDYRLKFALLMMTRVNEHHQREIKINSKIYDYIKRQNSLACVIRNKSREYQRGFVVGVSPTGESARFSSIEELPEGWCRGNKGRGKSKETLKNRKYYYDPNTLKAKSFKEYEEVPDGWLKGNPNADTSDKTNIRGTKYYHNPATGEEARRNECPDGWIEGRLLVWTTDGIVNKQQNRYDALPDGYRFGRTNKSGYKQNRRVR